MSTQNTDEVESQPATMLDEAKAQWHRLLAALTELSSEDVNQLEQEQEQHALFFILRTYCVPTVTDAIKPYLKALQHNKFQAPVDVRAVHALLDLERDLSSIENIRLEYIFDQLQYIRSSLNINKQ